jgi:hypothetical protein
LGLYLESTTDKPYASPGDSVQFEFEFTNRSNEKVVLNTLSETHLKVDTALNVPLNNNESLFFSISRIMTDQVPQTSPYWLEYPRKGYHYVIKDESKRGLANNKIPVVFHAEIIISGEVITYDIPVVYTWTDRMQGQQYEPFEVGPRLFTDITNGVYIFPDQSGKSVQISIESKNQAVEGKLILQVPEGWRYSPAEIPFSIPPESSDSFIFNLFPPEKASKGTIKAVAMSGTDFYDRNLIRIEYDHFPKQLVFLPAEAVVVKLDIDKKGDRIGYIMGAGDEVGESLSQIGYEVFYINEQNIEKLDFNQFNAIVFGIMAFNNNSFVNDYKEEFLAYVQNGGNLIVQYTNIRIGLKSEIVMPYPIDFSRNSASVRVSEEDAEIVILNPDHPVLNNPNKITSRDFEGWIQERGLYFPIGWDDHYSAILSSHDTGEEPLNGGLLVAPYGKGYYIYTSYSWFRQLPAGVPGSFRIFANMISLGK